MENIEEKIKVILQKGKTFDDFLEAYNYFLRYQNSKDGKDRKSWEKKSFIYLYRSLNRQYFEFSIPRNTDSYDEICSYLNFI